MITVRLRYGDVVVLIQTDAELHPDVLDEMCSRAKTLFLETQAGLPNDDDSGAKDVQA